MARFVNETATIAAGQSISSVVECDTGAPVFVFMPNEWTSAMISFQVSPDGVVFRDLFDNSGRELVFNIPAGGCVGVPAVWDAVLFLKVRSGSRDNPVQQESARAITITVDTSAPR
jgi:hypothetical protein